MKINLVNLVQNKIYKNPINKEKSAQTAPSKSNFPPAKSWWRCTLRNNYKNITCLMFLKN